MAGSGTYVDVDEGNVEPGWLTQKELVTSRFDQTIGLAESMQVKVDAYLQAMDDLSAEFELPDGWDDALSDVVLDPLPSYDFGQAPSFGDLDLPDDWPDTFPILSALKPVPEVDLSIDEPIAPDEISPSISHIDATYTSGMWLALYNKVLNEIEAGSTGLEPAVEQAIYDRAKERQRKENEAQYNKLMDAIATTGFDMPPGAVVGVQQTMAEEILRQAVDINEKIFIAQGDLAQKNTHFMVDKGVTLEGLLREFHNNRENRMLEAEKATGALVVQVYEANVKAYMSRWEGQKLKIEAGISQIDAVLKENQFLIEGFKAEMEGAVAQIDATAKQTDAMVEGYKGQVAGYTAQVGATATWYKALSEQQKNQLGVAEIELRKAIAAIDSEVKGYVSYNDLKRQLITDMANIASQSVASALNAVNASASLGYSGSESVGESWNHSDSIGETHSFDETPT